MTESPVQSSGLGSGLGSGLAGAQEPRRVPRSDLPAAFSDPAYLAAVVDVLCAIAYGEISAFERLSEDAKMAPGLRDKAELARMATTELTHFEGLCRRLEDLGADAFEAMSPFGAPFESCPARTPPAGRQEGLVKAYGDTGPGAHVYREIPAFVDPDPRRIIVESLA